MNAVTHPYSRDLTMNTPADPAVVAASVTTAIIGIGAGVRFAIKLFFRDRVDVSASSATNEVINTLRDEVGRLAKTVAELSRVNEEVRAERDRLRVEVTHLTFAVNSFRDLFTELLGEKEASRRLRERGIEYNPVSVPDADKE